FHAIEFSSKAPKIIPRLPLSKPFAILISVKTSAIIQHQNTSKFKQSNYYRSDFSIFFNW
ncbi:MAG: hypothetical protein ACK5YS_01240, partial [bacterium]